MTDSGSAGAVVRLWDEQRCAARSHDVYFVYDAVFGDRSDEKRWQADMFERHRAREGFRLVAAEADGMLLGFAWGYVGERGQWWSDQASQALPASVAEEWVGGHFEFVELAVLEAHRRAGLGARLHDALLDGVAAPRALLSTDDDAGTPARRLYEARGWCRLGILQPGVAVLGRSLPFESGGTRATSRVHR